RLSRQFFISVISKGIQAHVLAFPTPSIHAQFNSFIAIIKPLIFKIGNRHITRTFILCEPQIYPIMYLLTFLLLLILLNYTQKKTSLLFLIQNKTEIPNVNNILIIYILIAFHKMCRFIYKRYAFCIQ